MKATRKNLQSLIEGELVYRKSGYQIWFEGAGYYEDSRKPGQAPEFLGHTLKEAIEAIELQADYDATKRDEE